MSTKKNDSDRTFILNVRRVRMGVRSDISTGKPPVAKTQGGGGCSYSGSGGNN